MTQSANPSDGGFTIDMTQPGRRRQVALIVLKSRLTLALHFGQTDRIALKAARGWHAKDAEEAGQKPPVPFRTMKQAYAWVCEEVDKIEAENEAKHGN